MARHADFTPLLIQWLDSALSGDNALRQRIDPSQMKDEYHLVQSLVALAQIATDAANLQLVELSELQGKVTSIVHSLGTELTDSHVYLLPAILSSFK